MTDEDDRWLPPTPQDAPKGPSDEELPGSFSAPSPPAPEQPGSQWGPAGNVPGHPGASGAEPSNGKSVAALVLGIVGLPFICPLFVPSILAVVLGHIARGEYKRWGGQSSGKGMATAGIILGWVSLGLQAIGWTIIIVLLATDGLGDDRDGDGLPDWLDQEPDNPDAMIILPIGAAVVRAALSIGF